jgi:hypothetical protein
MLQDLDQMMIDRSSMPSRLGRSPRHRRLNLIIILPVDLRRSILAQVIR